MTQAVTQAAASAVSSSSASKPQLCLIDGSGFIFRAYHSLPPLTRPDGTPVNAVYGFTNMVLRLKEQLQVDYLAVIFDAGRKTFRNDLYVDYKANRPEPPEDLIPQFPLVREATLAMGIPAIELPGFEADDLIASYSKAALAAGMQVKIISSDKDLMQLVNDDVQLYDAMKQKMLGRDAVMEKFGVTPDKVIEVQALIGDSVDNVPGVPGIGPKTAAELIGQYGDVENLLAHLDEIKQPKRRQTLQAHAENARLSRQLVILKDDVPLPVPLETLGFALHCDDTLAAFLREQGFTSLLNRVGKAASTGASKAPVAQRQAATPAVAAAAIRVPVTPLETQYELVQDKAHLQQWVDKARAAGKVAFDVETDSLQALRAKLVGFSLAVEVGKACYVPLAHGTVAAQGDLLGDGATDIPQQIPLQEALEVLKPLLRDPSVVKIGHNMKYDMLVMRNHGLEIAPIEDTMLLSYVLDGTAHRHNMDALAERHLGHQTVTFSDVMATVGRKGATFADVELDKACAYAAEDADITLRLYEYLKPRLWQEGMAGMYECIERPLVPVLVAMEAEGVKVDTQLLQQMSQDFAKRMHALEQQAYALAGREFLLGSPKQLGEVLFDELKLDGGKKGKSGSYKTGADVLEELAEQGHALPKVLLDWRQLAKLKSTYTDALQQQVHPKTGRVHTSFSMAVTSTGRLSSSDPNLQNIPIRTEEGKAIRSAFIADTGRVILSADYSQIELRLLAHIAEIPELKDAFRRGEDIHKRTAAEIFGKSLDAVDDHDRRMAKTINFGIIYGMSAFGLASRLGMERAAAKAFIDRYFERYPGIAHYMEETKTFAAEHGFVRTLDGRKCTIEGMQVKALRAFAERAAINAPIQGTAADIVKKAMCAVHQALLEAGLCARMLLQVHDELLVEAPAEEAERVATLMKHTMEQVVRLDVPLVVDVGVGHSWAESH